jgi:hypothetical protein
MCLHDKKGKSSAILAELLYFHSFPNFRFSSIHAKEIVLEKEVVQSPTREQPALRG